MTLILGFGFLFGQMVAWRSLRVEGFYLERNPSSAFFYLLTGTHALHLTVGLIALTGNGRSTLAENADVVLDVTVEREACPLNLAPTTSTTAMLALMDALAVAAMRLRPTDYPFVL